MINVYLKFPSSIRNSESGLDITSEEILLAVMLLGNKTPKESYVSLNLIKSMYNISNKKINEFKELVTVVHDKGLVDIVNIEDIRKSINLDTLIITREVKTDKGEHYTLINRELVLRILNKKGLRIDKKGNLVYLLLVLQSRGGCRDFNNPDSVQKGFSYPSQQSLAADTNISRQAVNRGLQDLVDLGLLAIVNFGIYTTTNQKGNKEIKNFNHSYIVIQPEYTMKEILALRIASEQEIEKLKSEAHKDKMFSQLITHKTGDDYNENRELSREDELKLADYEKKHYEKIEKQRVEREIEEQQKNYKEWKKDIENGQKPY